MCSLAHNEPATYIYVYIYIYMYHWVMTWYDVLKLSISNVEYPLFIFLYRSLDKVYRYTNDTSHVRLTHMMNVALLVSFMSTLFENEW